MRAVLVYAVLALTLQPPLVAQQAPSVDPGQRIRISYDCRNRTSPTEAKGADCRRSVGTFVTRRGDTLALATKSSTVNYPLTTVARIELSRGRRSHSFAGMGVGFLVGTVAVYGLISSSESVASGAVGMALAVLFGGGPGAGLGAFVGSRVVTEGWQDVELDRLRVSIIPHRNGMGLGASLRF